MIKFFLGCILIVIINYYPVVIECQNKIKALTETTSDPGYVDAGVQLIRNPILQKPFGEFTSKFTESIMPP